MLLVLVHANGFSTRAVTDIYTSHMPFVTKISFSSGDRDVLAETAEKIQTLLDKKGGEYNGPHPIPAETVTVPLYQQLRVGEEFSSWRYSVFRRVIEIHGSNNIARDVLAQTFPDSLHVAVEIGKLGEMDDTDIRGGSTAIDSKETPQPKQDASVSHKQDAEHSDGTVSTDQNTPAKPDAQGLIRAETDLDQAVEHPETGDTQPIPELDDETEALREQAVEDAVESVPDNSTPTGTQTRQYTRSTVIREYVMARANGRCEGCGEPAPFTSKTGKPYLHGHHTDELSDGGSDKPASVIALCPNCHYRVHHGEDGAEYNRQLKTHVEKIEIYLDG